MNARKTISIEDRFKHSASLEVGQKGLQKVTKKNN